MVLDGCSHVSEVKDTLEKCIGRQISKVETNLFLIYGLSKKIVRAVLLFASKDISPELAILSEIS